MSHHVTKLLGCNNIELLPISENIIAEYCFKSAKDEGNDSTLHVLLNILYYRHLCL